MVNFIKTLGSQVKRKTLEVYYTCSNFVSVIDNAFVTCSVVCGAKWQHAVCSMQYAACSMQHAVCSMQYAVCSMQYAVCSI
jgi:hypothetical protein